MIERHRPSDPVPPGHHACPLCEQLVLSRCKGAHERGEKHRTLAEWARVAEAPGLIRISSVTKRILDKLGVPTTHGLSNVDLTSDRRRVRATQRGHYGPIEYHRMSRAAFRAGRDMDGREQLVSLFHRASFRQREAALALLTLRDADGNAPMRSADAVAVLLDLIRVLGGLR